MRTITQFSLPELLDNITTMLDTCKTRLGAVELDSTSKISHIRVRSQTPQQHAIYLDWTQNPDVFASVKENIYNGRTIVFARLKTPFRVQTGSTEAEIHYLEFTPPNPEHTSGPDAIVIKDDNVQENFIFNNSPLMVLRFQPLSADEILAR